jgi:hypothetical protein
MVPIVRAIVIKNSLRVSFRPTILRKSFRQIK